MNDKEVIEQADRIIDNLKHLKGIKEDTFIEDLKKCIERYKTRTIERNNINEEVRKNRPSKH